MANILDYIQWRGDLSFEQSPLNEVDALIFSQISYTDFSNLGVNGFTKNTITFKELMELFASSPDFEKRKYFGAMIDKRTVELIQNAASSKRFGEVKVCGFVNKIDLENEEQFSAITFILPENKFIIAYRGTDDTIVGWKEDFNLSYMDTVPSQVDALLYLEDAAHYLKGDIYLAGHSKGGNLAVYSASKCGLKIQKRIKKIFDNDGPGFPESFFASREYQEVKNKINLFVPENSIVGMLFEHDKNFVTVECDKRGIEQHNPFNWHLLCTDFIERADVTKESKIINKSVNQLFKDLDVEQRKIFIETIFGTLKETNALTNTELIKNPLESMGKVLKAVGQLDKKTKSAVWSTVQMMIKLVAQNLNQV